MDPVIIAAVLGTLALVGGGAYLFLKARGGPKEEPYHHFHCPHCRQRLRYRNRQAGHQGMCPRCSRSLTFPAKPPA